MKKPIAHIVLLSVFTVLGVSLSTADQVTLGNGDILNGKVITVTTNSLVIQDDTLGTLTLARAKISNVTFGAATAAARSLAMPNIVQKKPEADFEANSNSDLAAIAREIREHSNLVQHVEAQILGSSASPEAASKFNELLDELSSGQLDMNGLRAQAQSAADQLRDYKKEMGSDAGEEVNAYLAILNGFLRETAPTNGAAP
ncbi:MAG TPA: hypothetical protein VGY98_17140 [Verrucomicrobiae bacterium]|nr:hypothetical protein [Verrucomicrobiae bacterium]